MTDLLHPIIIPDSIATVRRPNPRNPVEPEAMHQFDAKTLFYDVFIDAEQHSLTAIGPPGLNLENYLDDLTLTVNGDKTRFTRRELPEQKISVLSARLATAAEYRITFAFSDFSESLTLTPERVPENRMALAAISKNNRIRWISDWVDFYRENYPIDEIFIYDNGSDNVDDLADILTGRATVVRWNFPYGPPGKVFNKFAQAGALNHCLQRFVRQGTLFNFDIDELLIADR